LFRGLYPLLHEKYDNIGRGDTVEGRGIAYHPPHTGGHPPLIYFKQSNKIDSPSYVKLDPTT